MRIFARILYSVFMVGLFLIVMTFPQEVMGNLYRENVFMEPITNEDSEYPRFYYFYTSIPNFQNDQALFYYENQGFEITAYEVLRAELDEFNTLTMTESIFFIVYSDTEDLSTLNHLHIYNEASTEYVDIELNKFRNLNILYGVNADLNVYVPKEDVLNEFDYNKISLVDDNDIERTNNDLILQEDQFITKEFIEGFYQDNNRLPTVSDISGLTDNHVFPNLTHVADEYSYIFTVSFVGYFVILILSMYFIFFRKRKNRYTN